MKKALLALALVTASTTVSAGAWERASTFFDKEVKPTSTYTVDASGWNPRVTEWTPADNPNWRCVFAGATKAGGVACYPAQQQSGVK